MVRSRLRARKIVQHGQHAKLEKKSPPTAAQAATKVALNAFPENFPTKKTCQNVPFAPLGNFINILGRLASKIAPCGQHANPESSFPKKVQAQQAGSVEIASLANLLIRPMPRDA